MGLALVLGLLRPGSMKMLREHLLPNRMDELSNSCCGNISIASETNRFVSCLFVAGTFSNLFAHQNG